MEHSESEERWVTIGREANGALLVVIHTWQDLGPHSPSPHHFCPSR